MEHVKNEKIEWKCMCPLLNVFAYSLRSPLKWLSIYFGYSTVSRTPLDIMARETRTDSWYNCPTMETFYTFDSTISNAIGSIPVEPWSCVSQTLPPINGHHTSCKLSRFDAGSKNNCPNCPNQNCDPHTKKKRRIAYHQRQSADRYRLLQDHKE